MTNAFLLCFREGLLTVARWLGHDPPTKLPDWHREIEASDPVDYLKELSGNSKVYLSKAEAAMGTHDWGALETIWRAHESLMLEAKHAEIDFDRKTGRIPRMNRKLALSRLADLRADSKWLGFVTTRAEEAAKESEGES